MNPIARKDKLTIRELPDEAVIYDLERHKMHCLNRTAVLVWKHCDGRHDPAALAALLGRELLLPADEAAAAARLALEQLGRRRLLTEEVLAPEDEERLSRRAVLRRMAGIAAVAAVLPLVMTLKSPSVAWAQPTSSEGTECTPGIPGLCPAGFQCVPTTPQQIQTGPHNSKKSTQGFGQGTCQPIVGPTTTTTTSAPLCQTNGQPCTGANGTQGNCCVNGLCLGGVCS